MCYVHVAVQEVYLSLFNLSLARHLMEYKKHGRPYIRHYHVSPDVTYALCMNPWMTEVFSKSEFVELDVTYEVSTELPYLLNVVTFDYTSCQCECLN